MEYRQCGKTGPDLSRIGVECWQFGGGDYWGPVDQKAVDGVVRRALDVGINYFDTAEVYNNGRSETALGNAIRDLPRDRMIIGAKISPVACYPEVLTTHCEASLRRLGTDYVDLYMIHWPFGRHSLRHFTANEVVLGDPPRVEDALATMGKLKDQGKIRQVGISNFARPPLQQVLATGGGVAVNELPYSLLTRAIEIEALPFCREAGIGIIAYMTLMQGILTGTYASLDAIPPLHRRTRHFDSGKFPGCRHGEPGFEAETSRALDAIRQVAQDAGMPMATLALKWVLANPDITCALVGTRSATRLEENARVADDPLPTDIVARLNDITEPLLQALGSGFDYYERPANDRTRGL